MAYNVKKNDKNEAEVSKKTDKDFVTKLAQIHSALFDY
jgi:hypothetical protein